MAKINVKNTSVKVGTINNSDYISLTDIAMYKTDDKIAGIANWIQKRNKIEFLSILQTLYNPNFKPLEFEGFKKEAGLNAFTMSSATAQLHRAVKNQKCHTIQSSGSRCCWLGVCNADLLQN
jgi:hypothetical protein